MAQLKFCDLSNLVDATSLIISKEVGVNLSKFRGHILQGGLSFQTEFALLQHQFSLNAIPSAIP